MHNFILLTLNSFNLAILFSVIILFIIFYYFIIKVWLSNTSWTFNSVHYQAKQRVHLGETARLGGVIIFFILAIISFFQSNQEFALQLQQCLACAVPMMLVTVKEDLTHNVDYRIRFLSLIVSAALLIIYTNDGLPFVSNIIVISQLFEYPFLSIVFFTLCLVALANGCNFIDGMNGLLGFYLLGAMFSCLQLAFFVENTFISKFLIIYIIMTLLFLSVNFPWGKLFMGDAGAYLMPMLVGIWVINFFGTYESISSWNAGLIFFYPIAEVSYSFLRKLYQKKSPFHPDREHLHLKIFDILNTSMNKPRLSNNLTTLFLSVFWLTPPLILPWVFESQPMIALSILVLSLIYLIINRVIPAKTQY
jgi:UDP-GlcNAc:undecaprenyl-phosphate/decaprenyl-phosphate GlcNAc-1-phosphate transferase